jgi:PH domain
MRKYDYHDVVSNKTFSVTGLTAHIAHEVASIAYDNYSKSKGAKSNTSGEATIHSDSTLSGYLWKQEQSSRGRAYWTRRYFVCADAADKVSSTSLPFLHQHDSEQQARRREQTATKKNRLPLKDCTVNSLKSSSATTTTTSSVSVSLVDGESSVASKYEFVVAAIGGRIQWHLAAPTAMDRECWINIFRQQAAE